MDPAGHHDTRAEPGAHPVIVFIERRGQRAAVVVSPGRYERMVQALEDAENAAAFDVTMAEEGGNISWGRAKTDLES